MHVQGRGGIEFIRVYLARAYTTLVLVMLVFVFSVLCVYPEGESLIKEQGQLPLYKLGPGTLF